MSTIFKNPPLQARLIQPKSFEDCLTYGEQIYCLYKMILELDEKIDRLSGNTNTNNSNGGGGGEIGGDDTPPSESVPPSSGGGGGEIGGDG
jgi:hypothetical protein